MNKKLIRKISLTCNDDKRSKYPEKKWKVIKPQYTSKKNFNLEDRAKNLIDIKNILDDLEVPFFLTHGALLGVYREGDFIKYDDDIDLDIFEEIFLLKYDQICDALIENGFVVRGRKIQYRGEKGEKVNLYRNKDKVNIRGIYIDSDYKENKYYLTNVFQYLRKFHENPDTIVFKGVTFMTPGPIEDFLVYCFGKNWRTPAYKTKKSKEKGQERGVRRSSV